MILLDLDDRPMLDLKQQMLYIFESYKNSRPGQSNLFGQLLRTYRNDMLDNAGNIEAQMNAIKTSLNTIYNRYGFDTDLEIMVNFNNEYNSFEVDVSGTLNGVFEKLSNTLILENK